MGLPPASVALAGCSLPALYLKLVDLVLTKAKTGLGLCCPFEHSCYSIGTACSDFALPTFYEGRYLTYNISRTYCTVPLLCLAFPELDELRRLRCRDL